MKKLRTAKRAKSAIPPQGETEAGPVSAPAPTFPIVGIGASAGGLDAFSALLRNLPLDTGMGFVLVQHLDPEHESALTKLLGRTTSLPIDEVTNNLAVEPNHVYVIPPNTNLSITAGVLNLHPRSKVRAALRSIDSFFESLAQDRRELSIGVILSGTASDGTLGLEAIKSEGGITFAQDESARHDSMPRSAVASGCVDFVLSPEEIALELGRIAKHPAVNGSSPDPFRQAEDERSSSTFHEDDPTPLPSGGHGTPPTGAERVRAEADHAPREKGNAKTDEQFKTILHLLHRHSSADFSLYRSNTVRRRIIRRMVLTKHETLASYTHFLKGNDAELTALYSDVLISVTSFFRNPEAFEVLSRKVWPALLQRRGGEPIRVWTLGCSTGQEAYSVAISFLEAEQKDPRMRKLQVFATDLNEALLEKARSGLYAKSIVQDLSPERLRRFFVQEEGGYRVTKSLREMIVFARQNVICDPPFSRLDLISCRNLLIYFEPGLQKKVFPVFHYALKPGGFLYLGASESIGGFTDLFEPLDKKYKIFKTKPAPARMFHLPAGGDKAAAPSNVRRVRVPFPPQFGGAAAAAGLNAGLAANEGLHGELNAQREADRVSVNQFTPPAVLINANLQILQFRGPTGAYLEPHSGKASFDLLRMARKGLLVPLRSAINQAKKDNATVRRENVRIEEDGDGRTLINLAVIPLKNLPERCFLVVFQAAEAVSHAAGTADEKARTAQPRAARAARGSDARRIAALEAELVEVRDNAQSIQEQYEAANEELQASSEEVQSTNEELQSINEELETGKEELESANEELTTVNEEMGNQYAELNRVIGDLNNIQNSAQFSIVLLGRDLTIRRFNLQAEKQLRLSASDIGRPLGNVRHDLDAPDLEAFVSDVIDGVHARAREVQDKHGCWFSLRARPYLTPDNKVDGAMLLLVDIDDLKRSQIATASAREYADNVIATMRDPLLVLDFNLRVESVNAAFYRIFEARPEDTIGMLVFDLGNGQWDLPELRVLFEDILPLRHTIDDFVIDWDFEKIGRHTMLLNARRMDRRPGGQERLVVVIEDITARKRAEEAQASMAAIVASSDDAIIGKELSGIVTSWNRGAERLFGYSALEMIGQPITLLLPPDRRDEERDIIERIRRGESVEHFPTVRLHKDGTLLDVSVAVSPIRDSRGQVLRASMIVHDISASRRAEVALRESEERYRTLFDIGPVAVYSCDAAGVIQQYNRSAAELWGRAPVVGDTNQRFCGSFKMFRPDGSFMPHELGPMAEVLAGKVAEVRDAEVQIERPDGTRIFALMNIRPLKGTRGEITGAINYFYDITERKQAEMDLRDSDRRKTEFLAMLAHELRNPLAPIQFGIETLRRAEAAAAADAHQPRNHRPPATSANHALAVLQRQVGHMVRLVDDLLDAGRISQGKIELRKERIELSSVVSQAVDAVRPISESHNQELTVRLPSTPVYLDADPTRLGQIVGNLLNNACKFTQRGGHVWLTVQPEAEPATDGAADAFHPAPHVLIRVRDTGVGIAADQIKRVFEMFTQVDKSLERSMSGLGIGLTLARTLTEMHGGTVEVRSDGIGLGSEFIVRLPMAAGAAAIAPAPALAEPLPASSLRILVVDDNLDSATMLATLLRLSGHKTSVVHDGLAAVAAAAELDPDVILLDIGLPVLNGYEAARRIRGQRHGQGRPLMVALTGWGQDEDRRRSAEAGFDAHMVKPVDHAALAKLLAEFAVRKKSTTA